jgi:hypothetical protein
MSNPPKETVSVLVELPAGCKRTNLSIRALDQHTRDLAYQTFVMVEGKMLPCVGIKLLENGVLRLDVQPGFFEIKEREV